MRFALANGRSWRRSIEWWRRRERTDERAGAFRVDHHEVEVVLPPGRSADETFDELRERLMTYQHFPTAILRSRVDTPDRRIREGALIVQRAIAPMSPVAIEFGVVVTTIVDRSDPASREVAVAIATLDGHPEIGRERFAVRLDRAANRLTFTVDAESRHGPLLVRLSGPIARWFQLRATRALLRSVSGV